MDSNRRNSGTDKYQSEPIIDPSANSSTSQEHLPLLNRDNQAFTNMTSENSRSAKRMTPGSSGDSSNRSRASSYLQIAGDNSVTFLDHEDNASEYGGHNDNGADRSRRGSMTSQETTDLLDHRSPPSQATHQPRQHRAQTLSTDVGRPNVPEQPIPRLNLNSTTAASSFTPATYASSRTGYDSNTRFSGLNKFLKRRTSLTTPVPRRTSLSGDYLHDGDSYAVNVDPEASTSHDRNGDGGMQRFIDIESDEQSIKSKPSSRRSSDPSLADVCFPFEMVTETETGTASQSKFWPDLSVLNEFAEEELRDLAAADLHHDIQSSVLVEDVTGERTYSLSSERTRPKGQTVNDVEVEGRLRPQRIVPWVQSSFNPERNRQSSVNKNGLPSGLDEKSSLPYRFTYFRENMEATIHSASISGLLQPDQTFGDLFPPRPLKGSSFAETFHGYSGASRQPSRGMTSTLSHMETLPSSARSKESSGTQSPAVGHEDVVPFWLDVMNPTEEEMRVLSKAFGIHPLTTEDIFLGETREKVELFKHYYLVCFRSFDTNWEKDRRRQRTSAFKSSANTAATGGGGISTGTRPGGYVELDSGDIRKRRMSMQRPRSESGDFKSRRSRARASELKPLNMYIIVFPDGVITFHFAPTAHPVNVRRRARLLQDYITVTSDWISYALIDDITDGFGPMIESIEEEVNSIEDAILKMHSGHSDSEGSDDEEDEDGFSKRDAMSVMSKNSVSSSSTELSTTTKLWREKGDMLRRIGDCRKRVMSLLRLLGNKADVIKGFAKRCNEQWQPRTEIGLYLGDIQDHIVTMVQSLNHYEKLLARSHSNYLAQINIDMTRVNNDMNDVLSRITVLGAIVLPMNIVTGLWGMNVIVPGQGENSLMWFWYITGFLTLFGMLAFYIARRLYNI